VIIVAYNYLLVDIDMAIGQFEVLREVEPYRLDDMDAYSNALFVKEMTVELSDLAARCLSLDKYRPETCCVIGLPSPFSLMVWSVLAWAPIIMRKRRYTRSWSH